MLSILLIILIAIETNSGEVTTNILTTLSNDLKKSTFETYKNQTSNEENPECICIPYYNCLANGTVNKRGIDVIDLRLGSTQNSPQQCLNDTDVCCKVSHIKDPDTPIDPSLKPQDKVGCGYRNPNDSQNEFPWMVSIYEKERIDDKPQYTKRISYKCGGSLISKRVVLTAASCVSSYVPTRYTIRAGDLERPSSKKHWPHQDRNGAIIIHHPQFNKQNNENDIALVILKNSFVLTDNVKVICLAPNTSVINSQECFVSGYKSNYRDKQVKYYSALKNLNNLSVSSNECQTKFRDVQSIQPLPVQSSTLCANSIPDICKGDSGTPLICPLKEDPKRWAQFGVISENPTCDNNDSIPYANITTIRSWINESLKKYKINSASYTP